MRFSLSLCVVVYAVVMCAALSISATAAPPPNVVIILADDQSWTDYSFMGHPDIKTPHLDRLAADSAVFRRGYVPIALCRPSLASIVTGLYPHQHGIVGNDPTGRKGGLSREVYNQRCEQLIAKLDNVPTLPKILAENGYTSHQSGKWWEGSYQRGGFTHGMTRGFPEPGGRHGDDGLTIGRQGMSPVFEFIDSQVADETPFFCWYAPFLPHQPHNPPQRLLDKYRADGRPLPLAKYYAMCEWFDETCGELIDHLEKAGVRDNTLVVYVCDNGWIQDVSRPNGAFADRSKQSPYEMGTRTPIMFSWPGTIPSADRPELCTSLDIMPTILAATNHATPDNLPGLNLLPALKSGDSIDRDTIYGESFGHDVPELDNPEASLVFRWVIEGDWKLLLTYDGITDAVFYPPTDYRPQLFNLKDDPHENNNLAADHPERVDRLAKKLDQSWPLKERTTITNWSAEPQVLKPANPVK